MHCFSQVKIILKRIILIFLVALQFLGCSRLRSASEANDIAQSGTGVTAIDIKSNEFFWLLRPWKDGKLATMDGWGRFSELSFEGANKIRIKHVVNFPRWEVDNMFAVWPEADLWFITSARMNHIAYPPNKFTKSFMPFFTGMYEEYYPFLLDSHEGIIVFVYAPIELGKTGRHYVIYNYKQDKVIQETNKDKDDQVVYNCYLNDGVLLGSAFEQKDDAWVTTHFIYDWRTGKRTENKLTKKMTQLKLWGVLDDCLNKKKRFFITKSNIMDCYVKVNWEEDYKEITVTPLDVLLPKGKFNSGFMLSSDGEWGFSLIGIYDSIYGESLYKRAFYHIDDRYPEGVSFPIIVDYTNVPVESGVFVQHPVHGMCYAVEYHKIENDKDQLYLRLYKMDDVLTEINRQLLEGAKAVSKK